MERRLIARGHAEAADALRHVRQEAPLDLPRDLDVALELLARVQAAGRATRKELRRVAELALCNWPRISGAA